MVKSKEIELGVPDAVAIRGDIGESHDVQAYLLEVLRLRRPQGELPKGKRASSDCSYQRLFSLPSRPRDHLRDR